MLDHGSRIDGCFVRSTLIEPRTRDALAPFYFLDQTPESTLATSSLRPLDVLARICDTAKRSVSLRTPLLSLTRRQLTHSYGA